MVAMSSGYEFLFRRVKNLTQSISYENDNRPPNYSYVHPQQDQSYRCGYGPPPTERMPMLSREFNTETESGLSTVPRLADFPRSKNIPPWAVFAILSSCLYVGYTLNPLVNSETTRR